jgi:hypothetical protein
MDIDIQAAGLRVNVFGGFGMLGAGVDNAFDTNVSTLSGRAGLGGLNVLEADGLVIGDTSVSVSSVANNGTLATVAELAQGDLVTTGGAIVARVLAGDLSVGDGLAAPDGVGVSSAGGNIRLETAAGNGDMTIAANVNAGGGHLTLLGGSNVVIEANLITGASGTIDIEAVNGSVAMAIASVVRSDGGNLRIQAGVNVIVGLLDLRVPADRAASQRGDQANWGRVSVNAGAGSVTDAAAPGDGIVDIYAGEARLASSGSVGQNGATPNAIETEVMTLSVAAGVGGLNVVDATSVAIGTVGAVIVERVLPDGTTMTDGDASAQTGATKTGGESTISTETGEPVEGFPTFAVVNFLDAGSLPNVLTGLYEQRVTISNLNASTIDAVRVIIRGLQEGVKVANAVGVVAGDPFIQYNFPLAPGQAVTLVIEYQSPNSGVVPIAASFLPEATPVLAPLNPIGQIIDNVTTARLNDDRLSIAFNSLAARTYFVQYSDNGLDWITVLSPIDGTGRRIIWVDNGPPKTLSDTIGGVQRLYRVVLEDVVSP